MFATILGPTSPIGRMLPERLVPTGKLVAAVRLQGAIGRGGGLSRALSGESVEPLLKRAFEMKGVDAVALVINSPGGSAVQSHLIFRRIRELSEKKGKPVLAFAEDVAASGGYMIACAADEIFADPSSIVGSIGVVSGGFGFTEAIAKLGVERRLYTSGESKAMLDPFLPEKADEVARLRSLQEEVHRHFISLVRSRRGVKLVEDGEALFTGAFWSGERAKALGLIDGVGDMRGVLRERYGEDVRVSWIAPRRGFRLNLLRGASTAIQQAVADTLENRSLWSRFGL